MIHLEIRNDSIRKRLYRRTDLEQLAERIAAGERLRRNAEVSLLFCDDDFIAQLNKQYRGKRGPTDVLSFCQDGAPNQRVRILGDIVVSLETVERFCDADRAAMLQEVRLLFCHGLLHLLGHTHDEEADCAAMQAKQAKYLGVDMDAAWHSRKR